MNKNKFKFSEEFRQKVFKVFVENHGNAHATSRYFEGKPTTATIRQWAEEYDWDGQLDKVKKDTMVELGLSDDPFIQKLVDRNRFEVETLAVIQATVMKMFKGKKRSKMRPKSLREAIYALQFVANEYRERVPTGKSGDRDRLPPKTKESVREVLEDLLGDDPELKKKVVTQLRDRVRESRKLRVVGGTEA